MQPHRQQPTRLPRPWNSPGKNTGVGCHFLLQCIKVKSERKVAQSCPTLSDPMDCSLPGSSIHGILQARGLEWGVIAFSCSVAKLCLFVTPWSAARQPPRSSAVSQSMLRFMAIESVMLSNRLILCHPLLLLPSIFPSIRVFCSKLALCIRWPKYCSFSISPSNEYSELISFRIDWFDYLAVQGTLKNLL